MSDDQKEELKAIGYDIATVIKKEKEKKWFKSFHQFRKYLQVNNRYPTFTSNKELDNWVRTQRSERSSDSLCSNRMAVLNAIRFRWKDFM